jgi:hypothetical protein
MRFALCSGSLVSALKSARQLQQGTRGRRWNDQRSGSDLVHQIISNTVDVRRRGGKDMHVHGNQFDPNIQLYSLSAAARAEAKKAAERTRKKLLNAASALEGEFDDAGDCVVSLSEDSASGEQGNRQYHGGQKKHEDHANSEIVDDPFSDWA